MLDGFEEADQPPRQVLCRTPAIAEVRHDPGVNRILALNLADRAAGITGKERADADVVALEILPHQSGRSHPRRRISGAVAIQLVQPLRRDLQQFLQELGTAAVEGRLEHQARPEPAVGLGIQDDETAEVQRPDPVERKLRLALQPVVSKIGARIRIGAQVLPADLDACGIEWGDNGDG